MSPETRLRGLRSLLRGARARILAAFIVLLAASTLVSTIALREILQARASERVEESLEQAVGEFRVLASQGDNPLTGDPFDDVQAIFDVYFLRNVAVAGESAFTFLDGRAGETSWRQRPARLPQAVASLARISTSTRGTFRLPGGDVRYLAVPVRIGGRQRGVFAVAHDLREEAKEVDEASQVAGGVSLAVLLLASLLAFVIAGRVLAPLRAFTETARAITETDLTRRIDVEGEDEIAELGRTFNAMLDRLQAAFATQKDFASDAGHELRTPITIIRGDVDLDALSEELMAKASALAARDWQLVAVGVGRLTADRQRLTQAMMQLAQNAVQHTGEGDRIALGSALENGHARLWVSDSGPGVPAADRDRIFDRFARGSGTRRSEGAGLGLAIVSAIAEAHGGRVELEAARPGDGATFTITIPADTPEQEQVTT